MVKDQRKEIRWGKEVYCPVSIDSIRVGSTPEFPLFFRLGSGRDFVLYCDRNVVFTDEARTRLEDNEIEQLFIPRGNRQEYSRYLATHLEDILADENLSVHEKSGILYDSAQAVVEQLLQDPPSREGVSRGKDIVNHTVNLLSSQEFLLEDLLRSISCDYYLYTHSVNVVAYSVALAMQAGYGDRATLREVANGALLHDVGKRTLSQEILTKGERLSEQEWEEVRRHSREGYESLRETNALGEIALDIVLHHHERLDGSGYPDGLLASDISPFVRMVTIADIFDALTTDRYHQPARTSFQALHTMQRRMKGEIDIQLVRSFVEMLGTPKKKTSPSGP